VHFIGELNENPLVMKKILYILLFIPHALFGQDNYSLSFDGVGDYVQLSNIDIAETESFTWQIYIRFDQNVKTSLFTQYSSYSENGYYINYYDNRLCFSFADGSQVWSEPNLIEINIWNLLTVVKHEDTISHFLNGVDITSDNDILNSFSDNYQPSNENIIVGWSGSSTSNQGVDQWLDGNIKRISFWDRPLTQDKIQNYMTCPPTGDEEGLVGYWDFNEGEGNTVYDLSGNGNHGIISGATYSEDVPEESCDEQTQQSIIDSYFQHILDKGFIYGGTYESSYYFLSESEENWVNSDSICRSLGGNLVIIETPEENQFIIDSLNLSDDFSPGLWIGLYQNVQSSNYSEPSGGWQWVDGVELSYNNGMWNGFQNWNNREPSNSGHSGELYGNMWFQSHNSNELTGTWNDWINTANWSDSQTNYGLKYILEVKAKEGCTDSLMYNFNNQANIDNGSCEPFSYGCVDSTAYNFDEVANTNDGSCISIEEFTIDSLQEALSVFETVSDEEDYSMNFDGNEDNVQLSNSISFGTNSFSVSIDCYLNAFEGTDSEPYSYIVGVPLSEGTNDHGFKIQTSSIANNGGFAVHINDEGTTNFNVITFNNTIQNNVTLNKWYSLTMVVNRINNLFQFYVDGALVGTQPISSAFGNVDLGVPISIGYMSLWNSSYLDGLTDNLHIWNKPLTQQEIQNYMTCPPSGEEEGLVGYWNFNEGSGDSVYDLSGNGNHGIIHGANYSEDVHDSQKGCTDVKALNYDETALCDNGSCVYGDEVVSNLSDSLSTSQQNLTLLEGDASTSLSSMQLALDSWNTTIDLTAGWNMFGYGCPEPIDLVQAMSEHTDNIIILKDNNGKAYMPEFGFNGIGDLTPGQGYQIKVTDSIEGFSLCDWYVNDIPEDNIVSLQEENASMKAKLDCYENPQIGDYCFGGIIFHVSESVANTKYGLVTTDSLIGLGTHYDAIVMVENYENDGFDDWQLPSMNQLNLIYENLYLTGEVNYETEDIYNWYWAKNECTTNSSNVASDIHFVDGSFQYCNNADSNPGGILPIRAFGDWIMGCTDSTACNFNPEANMSDGSCEYAEEGYDCNGDILQFSLSFDGNDDYLYMDSLIFLHDEFTFSVKIKSSQVIGNEGPYNPLIYFGDRLNTNNENSDFEVYFGNNGITVVTNRSSSSGEGHYFTSPFDYSDWLTLTVSYNSGLVSIYFDGVLSDSHQFSHRSINSNYNDLFVGSSMFINGDGLNESYFNGKIDDIIFWNKSLTEFEVQSQFNYNQAMDENLVGYWNLNEGSDNTVYDISGNGNHGTINGAVYSDDAP